MAQDAARVLVLLGAGVSYGASRARSNFDSPNDSYQDFEPFPSWEGLMRIMLHRLKMLPDMKGREDNLESFFTRESPLDCAELARGVLGAETFNNVLRQAYGGPSHMFTSTSHEALVRLPLKEIFTTNYDTLIEDAFLGQELAVSAGPAQFIARMPQRPKRHLVKLHGTIDDLNTIVLTRSDYAKARKSRVEMFEHLRTSLMQSSFLFVGYSLTDPNFNLIHDEVRLVMGANMPPSYLVQGERDAVREAYLRQLGVNVISLGNWIYLPQLLTAINPDVALEDNLR